MSRDAKNKFYRTLQLDKESQAILKWYRGIVKSLQNESEFKVIEKKEDKE
jgi:hypothetical protein